MRPTTLGLKYLRHHKGRYALTALGVLLGVANVFGVFVANASTNRAFTEQGDRFLGGADVTVFDQSGPMEAEVIDRAASLTDVATVLAWRRGYAEVEVPDTEDEFVFVSGINLEGMRHLFTGHLAEGRLPRREGEVVVGHEAATTLGLRIGEPLTVPGSHLRLIVVGVLDTDAPLGPHNTYTTLTTDLPTGLEDGSWREAEVGPPVGALWLFLSPGADPELWVREHERDLSGLVVRAVEREELRRFLDLLQGALAGAAGIALFVGAFVIYLTFTMAIVERTRTYGMLHAVGATPRQVRRIVVGEALGVGAVGTIGGLAAGAGLAAVLLRVMARFHLAPEASLTVPASAVAVGVAVGVAATLIGASVPARLAGRLSPVEATATYHAVSKRSRTWITGVVLLAVGAAAALLPRGTEGFDPLGPVWVLTVLFGAVLMLPPLLGPLARLAGHAITRLVRGTGHVAVMHLVRERSRSAYTLGLVMVVLAMMLVAATMHRSLGTAVDRFVDLRFGADLQVWAGVPSRSIDDLRGLEEVRQVTPFQFGSTRVVSDGRPRPVPLVLIDPETFFEMAGFPWAEGDDRTVQPELQRGGAVVLTAAEARRFEVAPGDDLVLVNGSDEERRFRVVGTVAALGARADQGLVASRVDRQWFGLLDRTDIFFVNLVPGADPEVAGTAIENALADDSLGVFVQDSTTIKAEAQSQVRNYFGLFYAALLVAVVVGLFGLANTMAVAVLQRYREIGALRAIGATDTHIRRSVILEALTLGTVAFVLAVGLGAVLTKMILLGGEDLVGFALPFAFPWPWLPLLAGIAVGIALASALVPARRAVRLSPVEALRYE